VFIVNKMTKVKITDSRSRDLNRSPTILRTTKKTINKKAAICKSKRANNEAGKRKERPIVKMSMTEWMISIFILSV